MTVRIPVPDNYDLTELEIYRINKSNDDKFNGHIVTINNKNYYEYKTDHFSPYAMIDKNTAYDMIKSISYYLIIFLILPLIALFIIIFKKKKHKEDK